MRGQFAVGIQAHFARAKQQAGVANIMHSLHLLGANLFADPNEFTAAGELCQQFFFVQIGENGGQLPRRPRLVDHDRWLGIKGACGQVGGQYPAIAIDNICTAGYDMCTRRCDLRLARLACGQHAHTHTDHHKGKKEKRAQHQQAPFGTQTGFVAHYLVAGTDIGAFNCIRVFTLGAGVQNAG